MIGDNPSRELREKRTFTSLAFYSHLTMSQTLVLFFLPFIQNNTFHRVHVLYGGFGRTS